MSHSTRRHSRAQRPNSRHHFHPANLLMLKHVLLRATPVPAGTILPADNNILVSDQIKYTSAYLHPYVIISYQNQSSPICFNALVHNATSVSRTGSDIINKFRPTVNMFRILQVEHSFEFCKVREVLQHAETATLYNNVVAPVACSVDTQ